MRKLHATEMSISLNQYTNNQFAKVAETGPQTTTFGPNQMGLTQKLQGQPPQQQVHYQHITLGIRPKVDPKNGGAQVNHQKTVSNGSSIAYPFQTSTINVNQPISQTTQKPTRTAHLIQEQIHLNQGKGRQNNELLRADAGSLGSIPQHTSIQKSQSPRGVGQFKVPINQVQANSATLQIGVSSLPLSQSRSTKQGQMSTDPKSATTQNQASTATNFGVKVGLQPAKYQKEEPSKRTIVEGFRRTSEMDQPQASKQFSRAQTGINRRFQTQKNSRQQVAVAQGAGISNQIVQGNGFNKAAPLHQELLDLGMDALEQLDEETLSKIMQRQLQRRDVNLDKSQIMHLYRMSAIGQSNNKQQIIQNPLEQQLQQQKAQHQESEGFIRINTIISGPDHLGTTTGSQQQPAIGLLSASSNTNASQNQQNHQQQQFPIRNAIPTNVSQLKPPKSAASATHASFVGSNLHAGGQNFSYAATQQNQLLQQQQIQQQQNSQKRDTYNFVSQQQKQSVNSQEKLRRNLSKEYCPMIIKSTNKSLQGANNAQIVKGVLNSATKVRIDSSARKTPANGQRFPPTGQLYEHHMQVGQPNSLLNGQQQLGSAKVANQVQVGSEIYKTQSQQVLLHRQQRAQQPEDQRLGYEPDQSSVEVVRSATLVDINPFHRREGTDPGANAASYIATVAPVHQQTEPNQPKVHLQKSIEVAHQPGEVSITGQIAPTANQFFDFIFSSDEDNKEGKGLQIQMQDIVTPTNQEMTSKQMTTEGNQIENTQTQNVINEKVVEDYSPEASAENRKEIMDSMIQTNDSKILYTESAIAARHGSHAHNIQFMSSLGRQQAPQEISALIHRKQPGSALETIRSPKTNQIGCINYSQPHTDLLPIQQKSVQHNNSGAQAGHNNLLTSKPIGQQTAQGALTQIPSKHKFQQQPLIQQPPPTSSTHPQFKLSTPNKHEMGRMGQQVPSAAQPKGAAGQRPPGTRGSTTLAQQQQSGNTTNNNANSLIEQVGDNKPTAAARNLSHARQAVNKHQQEVGSAAAAASGGGGGYLRPKVLDFQPKHGQVDPLLAHRSRKRGPGASGGFHHNHTPAINMSTSSAFSQQHHYGARFNNNTAGGILRHF